uniref:uncharacterized protein LOC120329026 n=1 Tax=Styela clava TaxID=7725 RepID=UPI001939F320|nr:uncharacterized protein LOC120329026 [Styela clava]
MVLSDGKTEDWNTFMKICISEYQNDSIYRQMYPDDEERQQFLEYYYEHYYRAAFKDGKGHLAYIEAHDHDHNTSSMIGGITISHDWDETEIEDHRMKLINPFGWEKYLRRKQWLNENVFKKLAYISNSLEKTLLHFGSDVMKSQFRRLKSSTLWASIGGYMIAENIYSDKWAADECLVISILDSFKLARLYEANNHAKIVQAYVCRDGNSFKNYDDSISKDSIICILLCGEDDEEIVKYVKENTYDKNYSIDHKVLEQGRVLPTSH